MIRPTLSEVLQGRTPTFVPPACCAAPGVTAAISTAAAKSTTRYFDMTKLHDFGIAADNQPSCSRARKPIGKRARRSPKHRRSGGVHKQHADGRVPLLFALPRRRHYPG